MKFTEPETPDNSSVIDTFEAATQVVVMLATAYVAVRSALEPDQERTIKALMWQWVEGYCQRQATGWAHLADASKRAYDKTRLV